MLHFGLAAKLRGVWDRLAPPRLWSPWQRYLLLGALALHVVAALFCAGYFNPDEHFQILEFVRYKLGANQAGELTWEFSERIRPWLQPWLYLQLVRLQVALGVSNPFVQAAVLRLASALVGWGSLLIFARACCTWFTGERARAALIVGLSLAWFFPFLHARTSSENLSGSLFLIGLSIVVLVAERRWALLVTAGLLFGAAFDCRYQTGIMVAGVGVWLLLSRRFLGCFAVGAGLLLGLGAGVLVDRWGYGAWTFTAWRYFDANLRQGVAAQFSVEPWWFYLRKVVSRSPAGLGLLFVVLVPVAWLRRPAHLLTLVSAPFFLLHCVLAHKELRFIFPLAGVAVPLCIMGAQALRSAVAGRWPTVVLAPALQRWRRPLFALGIALALADLFYLLAGSLAPLRPEVPLFRALYEQNPKHLLLATLGPDSNPYVYGAGAAYRFYAPEEIEVTPLRDVDELRALLARSTLPVTLHWPLSTPPPGELPSSCHVVYRWPPGGLPEWLWRKVLPTRPGATVWRCLPHTE
jgi:GPI mannosyltransferase 3